MAAARNDEAVCPHRTRGEIPVEASIENSFDMTLNMGSASVWSRGAARNDSGAADIAPASTRRPAPAADALSEVLRLVRLTGAVFLRAELKAPWAVQAPPSKVLTAKVLPHAEHLVEYHLIVEGRCWIRLPDGDPMALSAGDLVMLPHGDAHRLSSEPGLDVAATDGADIELPAYGDIAHHHVSGHGATTRFACGYLAIDRRLCRGLLGALPRLLRIDARDGDLRGWLHTYMQLRAAEHGGFRPGDACVLSKLSELMFVEAVRRYVDALPPGQTGWLAGLRDPHVGRALGLIHQSPARPWTVEDLARAVGLSRSALAARFSDLIGTPPMQYLTQWRLALAAHRLQVSNRSAVAVAEEVGYDSEAAFNRAFKRAFGLPPATWRRRDGAAPAPR
jgi:AraC-like DNA-binding protein/mannose-6-phosphate isomerase-like protein (cupin superfamily)